MLDKKSEIIELARKDLLELTDIEDSPFEMIALDTFLDRCWLLGWLDRYEIEISRKELIDKLTAHFCSE